MPSFQAAKKAGLGSSSSQQNQKGQTDRSSSSAVASKTAVQSFIKAADPVTGQTQAPKSKSDKIVLHSNVQTDDSATPANAPGPWRREKMGVVTVYQPAGGAYDKNSEAFQVSRSTAVM